MCRPFLSGDYGIQVGREPFFKHPKHNSIVGDVVFSISFLLVVCLFHYDVNHTATTTTTNNNYTK